MVYNLSLFVPDCGLSVKMDKTIAYSRIALKILNMQVTTNFSIAFNVLDDADGALDLTLLKTFMMTRNKMTSSDILPGTTFGSMMKLIQDTVTNKIQGM